MAIPEEKLALARTMLERAARPLLLHDDDCDGVACFVMAYQFCQDGRGVCVKKNPILTADYVRKVEEHAPDLVVIMDKPGVEEEFFRNVSQPILWIDHHEPQTELVSHFQNVTYLNPRCFDDEDNRPTSHWLYKITGKNLWMATVGTVGDWFIPDWIAEFDAQYPGLLPESYETVEDIYKGSPLGELVTIINFNLKGTTTETRKSILTLTRIESPDEILKQTTPRGRFIWKKYKKLAEGYERHLEHAKRQAGKGVLLEYSYDDQSQSYTAELSNKLLVLYPEHVTVVCRKHDGKYKCSVRSKDVPLPEKVRTALEGLDGRGGGHTNACGVVVAEEDWETFRKRLKAQIAGTEKDTSEK